MPELNEAVNTVAPAPTEQVVNQVEESTEQEATPVEQTPEPQSPSPEGVGEGEVDEKGVPYKNRYMEAHRKLQSIQQEYNGLQSNLPKIVEDAVAKAIPQTSTTPTYSKEELIKFKNTADNPDHRAWAEIELEKVRSKETRDYFESQTKAKETEFRVNQERDNAFRYVASNYGVMLNPDGSWNNANPLTQKLARIYNSDETLKNHPSGLRVAADMAIAEHIRETQPQMMNRELKLKRQVKKLEKATQLEGAGQPQSQKKPDAYGDAMIRLEKRGDKDSLKSVSAELIKKVHAGLV
jgi:hypothetical protein